MPPCQRCCCCSIHANVFSSDKAGSPSFSCVFCLLLKLLKAPCCSHFLLLSPNQKKIIFRKDKQDSKSWSCIANQLLSIKDIFFFALHFHVYLFPPILTLCLLAVFCLQSAAPKEGVADPNRTSGQRPQPQGCLSTVWCDTHVLPLDL